ncbi:MAG: phosphoribosylanthranilate isomerase [Calditrichaeota bacterium]|nr:phosphoribosylanthranilate isomerase [Calditrichota bacterium]
MGWLSEIKSKTPLVKICCIQSVEEAFLAMRFGASLLGLVSEMPSGPGAISEEKIEKIATAVPRGITTVLLTSLTNAEEIIRQQRRCKTNAIQLVDRSKGDDLRKLKDSLPGIGLIQVIHIAGEESITVAEEIVSFVDAILLDSGNPNLTVKELGGTGRVHDWRISARIRELSAKPVFLAGGLTPENVKSAIETVKPFAVDVCSGVRSNGYLNEEKLKRFFAAIKSATKP